ncbi:MAG: cysteine synthase A [Victivallaceae bacterium]
MKTYDNISQTVGKTPLVRYRGGLTENNAKIYAKMEFYNPTSSVKDRIAVSMINDAEQKGLLKPGGLIIEPTSGNTGLGLAMVAAARGYKLIITMPESMSLERRALLQHLGAKIVLTPADTGMSGAIKRAEELVTENENTFMPQQFNNPANPQAHYETTAVEIWNDLDGKVDIFVAGVGTGGTLTGIAKFLKEKNPAIKVIAVEPSASAVISGHAPGKHGIQGIGAGFIPHVLDTGLLDETIQISDEESIEYARKAAAEEGILCGISAGAAAAAAVTVAKRPENASKTIVTIFPDTAERYLTSGLFYKIG